MNSTNALLLNRLFTRNTFKNLIEYSRDEIYYAAVRRYIENPCDKSNLELVSEIYEILKKEYQNEYFYKNTLLNKLLLGVHNTRTTTALTELPVNKSKADFILINGKAIVYEIKTSLDNLDRLEGQLYDYYKAFTRVTVVTSEKNYSNVSNRLKDTPTGIYVLTSKGVVSRKKEPGEYVDKLEKETIFKVLRKREYESIIKDYYGYLPEVSSFSYYGCCKKLFEQISIDIIYKKFIEILKKRMIIDIEEYNKIPYELKFLIYFSNLKKNDYKKLFVFLNKQEVQECICRF